jgi:diguanylate cyclase (GGDEF)-like protein
MMTVSIPTLQLTELIVFMTCGLVFVYGWFLRRDEFSFLCFGSNYLISAAITVGFDDFGRYGSWLSSLGWSLTACMFWVGFRVFDGRRPLTPVMAVLTLLPALLHVGLAAIGRDADTVNTVSTLAYAQLEAAIAIYVLSTSRGSAIRRIAGLAQAAIAAALCLPILPFSPNVEQLTVVIVAINDHVTSIVLTTAILALQSERAYAALEQIANHDPLTGALNRKGLDRELKKERKVAGVIVADLDHFKAINDRFGHAAGDDVLREFVKCAKSVLPEAAILARLGGEEFVIVLEGHDRHATVFLAERLRFTLQDKPIAWNGHSIAVTVSLGVEMTDDGAEVVAAIERADAALYKAKISGRNRVQVV